MYMKRTCKNKNRNTSNNTRMNQTWNNLVTPEALVNQMLLQDESSGVKIIELNSSSDSSKESTKNGNHTWSYVNNDKHFVEKEDEDYAVNEEARRRRRMNMDHNEAFAAAYANNYYYDDGRSNSSFYERYDAEYNSVPINHHMNYFTFVNNELIKSESSTDNENYEPLEIIELDDSMEAHHWENIDETVMFDPNIRQEKRTIWIYSYKNKRLLSENDFELVNIPSRDATNTSTSCSISDEEVNVDQAVTAVRLGSPIPTAYIPRLDLSLVQTLSTVTEISEPNKSNSKDLSQDVMNQKLRNNWLTERIDQFEKIENSNVINWMALSPRERRRRSINTKSDYIEQQNVRKQEITYAEGNVISEDCHESSRTESATIKVQADIHVNSNSNKELSTNRSTNYDFKPAVKKKIVDIIPMKISYADTDEEHDVNNTELDHSKRPSIKIGTKLNKTEITEPIEKLGGENWITEEKIENETTVYDYDLETVEDTNVTVTSSENDLVDSANTRLWMKNMRLMRPSQWAEYLPITCSPHSLHLSLSINSLDEKKSWFKRLTKCIKCCK